MYRRGREYGTHVTLDEALSGVHAGAESGLQFVCLGANIARQFEFAQGAWIASGKFDGLPDEPDPLLGPRTPRADGARTDHFSMPQAGGPDERLADLPDFVTVVGGAYFFLPGIRALRHLSQPR